MRGLHLVAAVLLFGQGSAGHTGRKVTLNLPHRPALGETIVLKVEVGKIGHDELHVTTSDGRELGTISTYGVKGQRAAGTYTLPVPVDAVSGNHLTVLLSVIEGSKEHAATRREVTGLSLTVERVQP